MLISKLTPVSIVCIAAAIYIIVLLFKLGTDYNILAAVLVYLVVFVIVFAVDRYLVTKVAYKKLIVFELIFIVATVAAILYGFRKTELQIETELPLYFVIYDNKGLKKDELPSRRQGILGRVFTVKGDSVFHLNKNLEGWYINPPQNWQNPTIERGEAIINSEKVTVAAYARDMDYKKLKQLLDDEIKRLSDQ